MNELSCPTCGSTDIRFRDYIPRSAPLEKHTGRSIRVLLEQQELDYENATLRRLLCAECCTSFSIPKDVVVTFQA